MSGAPKKLRHRLTELVLQEVSLVDRPANPRATVVLFKRDSSKEMDMTDEAKKLADAIAKAGELAASVTAKDTEIAFLKGNLDKQTASLATVTTERDELSAKVKELTKGEDKPIELPKEAQDQINKALADAAASREELAKMRDTADTAVYIAKATVLKSLPQKPEEFGPLLMRVARNKTTAEDVTALETLLKAADAAIETGVLREAGTNNSGSGVVADRIDNLAKEVMKSDRISYEAAYDKVITANPALYRQYTAESQ